MYNKEKMKGDFSMDTTIQALQEYMNSAHSVYHAVAGVVWALEAEGYVQLREQDAWQLYPGGKYYVTRGDSAVIAFRLGAGKPEGFMMAAAHADRPTFKWKENGELKGAYTRLAVERYGGMLMAPWLDRPLSLAGRVLVETEDGVESRLVDLDRDLFMIPNVAIHMNRKANEGYAWNPAVDMLPLAGGKDAAGKLDGLLREAAGGEILGHDLFLYVRQQATCWGLDNEYLSAQALDDLACVWCAMQGFLAARESGSVPVLCVFDSEEVGSQTAQGAASGLLEDVLERICKDQNWELKQLLSQSFMLSADNAHAIHPNHPEYADPNNAPTVNGGVVLKFNANQRYTTDGVSASIFRKVCQRAGVKAQTYCNRADIAGGSTLGNISLSHVAVPSADIGLPQLAMHSCYETVGTRDVQDMVEVMRAYYGSTLICPAEGSFVLE